MGQSATQSIFETELNWSLRAVPDSQLNVSGLLLLFFFLEGLLFFTSIVCMSSLIMIGVLGIHFKLMSDNCTCKTSVLGEHWSEISLSDLENISKYMSTEKKLKISYSAYYHNSYPSGTALMISAFAQSVLKFCWLPSHIKIGSHKCVFFFFFHENCSDCVVSCKFEMILWQELFDIPIYQSFLSS